MDEGVIKYRQKNFTQCDSLLTIEYHNLEIWREKLYRLKLIGEYPSLKLGYGNVSNVQDYSKYHKTKSPQFVITATQTGNLESLDGRFYCRVLDFDLKKFEIQIMGPVEASSEALTHAAIYQANSEIKAIFHIHNKIIWDELLKNPLTRTSFVDYGTSEMAMNASEFAKSHSSGIFAMSGHEEGVISYGKSLQEAGDLILKAYAEFVGNLPISTD